MEEKKLTFAECEKALNSLVYDLAGQVAREHPELVGHIGALTFAAYLAGAAATFAAIAMKHPELNRITEDFLNLAGVTSGFLTSLFGKTEAEVH